MEMIFLLDNQIHKEKRSGLWLGKNNSAHLDVFKSIFYAH